LNAVGFLLAAENADAVFGPMRAHRRQLPAYSRAILAWIISMRFSGGF
jgi:hypothetical protein